MNDEEEPFPVLEWKTEECECFRYADGRYHLLWLTGMYEGGSFLVATFRDAASARGYAMHEGLMR